MAYDEVLAGRIRDFLGAGEDLSEKKMFGGIAFMSRGNMLVGITKNDLMVRVGPDRHDDALERTGARPMDFSGRPMRGMVFVEPAGYASDEQLREWLDLALTFGATLPAKEAKKASPRQRARK